jgi:hypothetical protein
MGGNAMKMGFMTITGALLAAPLLAALTTAASASPEKLVIALSNAYFGNT